jgi:serine/threonine protein kinase/class 3 adenylate cyclase
MLAEPPRMPSMPATEIRAFVFTDIVGSTRLKKLMPGRDNAERSVLFSEKILTPHRALIEKALARYDGRLISTQGDGHFLEFKSSVQAVMWAVELQQLHQRSPIETPGGGRLGLKIGIHMGPASADPDRPDDYVGTSVDYAARLVKLGTDGRIVVSEIVATFVRDEEIIGVTMHEHGLFDLTGIGSRRVFEVVYDGGTPEPLKSVDGARASDSLPPGSGGSQSTPAPRGGAMTVVQARAGLRIKDYELLEEIGEGGMGKVFKARHVGMGRICVLKLIKESLLRPGNNEILERFYQEIQLVAQLKHPNIVHAYHSSSRDDEYHFLVMEYIDGRTLDQLIDDRGPLALGEACEIVRQAACGLQCIHEHGLVHRDIKPSNLMIAAADSSPSGRPAHDVVKILDLGLALLVGDRDARITQFRDRAIGTAFYMAPEQWASTTVDIRADIYSLGCTFYHMVAGEPPFGDSQFGLEHAHRAVPIGPPQTTEPLPDKLLEIMMRMLAKNPQDRFSEPKEIAEQIDHFSDASTLGLGRPRRRERVPPRPRADSETPVSRFDDTAAHDIRFDSGLPRKQTLGRGRAIKIVGVLAAVLLAALLGSRLLRSRLVVDSPAHAAAAQHFLLTMPGMNGGWWFDEIPWFFPAMREHLLSQLTVDQFLELQKLGRGTDVDTFYGRLKDLSKESLKATKDGKPIVSNRFVKLFYDLEDSRPFDEFDPAAAKESVWYELDQRLQGEVAGDAENADAENADVENAEVQNAEVQNAEVQNANVQKPKAGDLHLRALLKWQMRDADEADKLFEQARAAYHADGNLLQALCIADHAMMLRQLRRWREAGKRFVAARDTIPQPELAPAMVVFSYGMEAEVKLFDASKERSGIRDLFAAARQEPYASALDANHPLWALLVSREALYGLETWKLKEAEQKAEEAHQMFAGDPRGQRADLYFRSRQFIAMAQHFLGKMDDAEDEFEGLLRFIDELLASDKIADNAKPQWRRLKPNLLERLGDVRFFGQGETAKAATTWDQAALEGRSFKGGPKAPYLARLHFKRALAYALAGQSAEAQLALDEGTSVAQPIDRDEQQTVFRVYQNAAAAFLAPNEEQIDALIKVLDDADPSQETAENANRDDMQILLFICDYLLQQSESQPDAVDATRRAMIDNQRRRLGANLEREGKDYLAAIEAAAAKLVP